MDGAPRPPEGTIALLFTDIEGSTRLATTLAADWADVLADHHALVGGAIEAATSSCARRRNGWAPRVRRSSRARGRGVAPGVRVARACELARERQPA